MARMVVTKAKAGTKDRIVSATAEMFRRRGYEGTGLKQITVAAEAPFGSLYHFFPGGKEELGAEVIRISGADYARMGASIFQGAPDLVTGVRWFFAGAAQTLVDTDYADACPIATVALEISSTSEPMREAAAEVFASWISMLQFVFVAEGIDADRSRQLAITMLSLLEGAFVFCRAMRSTESLEVAGLMSVGAVEAALRDVDVSTGRKSVVRKQPRGRS